MAYWQGHLQKGMQMDNNDHKLISSNWNECAADATHMETCLLKTREDGECDKSFEIGWLTIRGPHARVATSIEECTETENLVAQLFHHTKLTMKQRTVLCMRFGLPLKGRSYGHELTLAEAGEELWLSREQIRQIELRGLAKMRHTALCKLRIQDH